MRYELSLFHVACFLPGSKYVALKLLALRNRQPIVKITTALYIPCLYALVSVDTLNRLRLIGPARVFPASFSEAEEAKCCLRGRRLVIDCSDRSCPHGCIPCQRKLYNSENMMSGDNERARPQVLSVGVAATDREMAIRAFNYGFLSER